MTFGQKLQKLRKAKGWTQEELAAQIVVSRQALSKWEQGIVIPDTENVLQISKIFCVSTDYLLNDDFESDADIPAVCVSGEKLSRKYRKKTQTIIGACIFGIGAVGFALLYILSWYFPVNFPVYEEGVLPQTARGFSVFIYENDLGWLVATCVTAIILGMLIITVPRVIRLAKRINSTR